MGPVRRARILVPLSLALCVAGFTAVSQVQPADAARATRSSAGVTVRDPAKHGRPARAVSRSIGKPAGEPTLAINASGHIFYAAVDVARLAAVDVLRSDDEGRTWENVSPRLQGQKLHPLSLDPYVYIDQRSQRLFTIDLTIACSYMSFSDDDGATWTTNPLACGRPINDHQTLFSGRPRSSTTSGIENVLYYCWNDVLDSACTKSLDGGLTFIPTGEPAFVGVDPEGRPGIGGVPGLCSGLHGHGVSDDKGNIYLPREFCGQPWLAMSSDEGLTWERVQVADTGVNGPQASGSNPSVAVDEEGNIYYAWVARDRLPYMVVSRDRGQTWSEPMALGARRLQEANLLTIDVGAPGKAAFAYMGSENSGYQECYPECEGVRAKTTWNGYIGSSANVFATHPSFVIVPANPPDDPMKVGACGPGRCGDTILDFLDVVIDGNGIANAAFVDACVGCTSSSLTDTGNEGLLVRLVGGHRLR